MNYLRQRMQRTLGVMGSREVFGRRLCFWICRDGKWRNDFLEASWALNSLDVKEAKTTLMGSKAGADMNNGLTINGEDHSLLYEKKY